MLDSSSTRIGVRLADIPLDREDWRRPFGWPVPFDDLFKLNHRLQHRFFEFLVGLEGDERDVMALARPLAGTAIVMETAVALQAEAASGLRLEGPPELAVLRGDALVDELEESSLVDMGSAKLTTQIPYQTLRRLVRTLSWTPLPRLPATLAAPQALAVTHNPLLVAEARRRRARLWFNHAAPLLDRMRQGVSEAPLLDGPEHVDALAERALRGLIDDQALTDEMRERAIALLRPVYVGTLAQAAHTLGVLRRVDRLPNALWSGTGGLMPARALGIEVMRRGGTVTRFGHGGTMPLLAEPYSMVNLELSVTSEFVLPSAMAARQSAVTRAADLSRPFGLSSVVGGRGDPSLDPGPNSTRSVKRRPRVLFVATAYYGYSQVYPSLTPAPVYLEWHHRILEMLGALPIDLIHKPHPEGLFRGRPPGLDHLARIDQRPFEQAMIDADCLVFDLAASTTFSIALSSDRRIVLLDFGSLRFSEESRPLIEARCRIVPVIADDRNRATVEAEALKAAVCASEPAPDPAPFRSLFLAEGEFDR